MGPPRMLPKLEAVAAVVSFLLIFCVGFIFHALIPAGLSEEKAGMLTRLSVLLLFFVFGFACIGLMIHVFILMQVKIGNAAAPMIRFLAQHETGVTVAFWCFLGLGVLIAMPFILVDMVGLKIPLAPSRGLLVADIGMTIDEARARSTLNFKEPRHMGDGSWLGVADVVFDFQIVNSSVRFAQSRYYWMETPKNDRHISTLNIGISPRKMPIPELDVFQHNLQQALFNEGWMPGHYVAQSEETVRLWSGKRTTGDGRYWARGETLLIFERNRMDERKYDEPPGSGEYIVYLHIMPKSRERRLVFERSAWENRSE
jgi:hypothetical protein